MENPQLYIQTLAILAYAYTIRVFIIEGELTNKHNEVEFSQSDQCIQ